MEYSNMDLHDLTCIFGFFYSFFQVIRTSALTSVMNLPQIREFFMLIIIVCTLLLIPKSRFSKKEWFIFLICFLIFLLNSIVSSTIVLLMNILLVYSFGKHPQKINKFVRCVLLGLICGVILIITLAVLGIIPNHFRVQGGRARYSLGFASPVALPDTYVGIIVCHIFLNKNKIKKTSLLLLLIPSIIIMQLTDGRSSFGISLIIIMGIIFLGNLNEERRIRMIKYLSSFSVLLLFFGILFSIYAAINFENSSFLLDLDSLFTGRFYWFSQAWTQTSVLPFGNNVFEADERITLDNIYLTLILRGGIFVFLVFVMSIIKLISYLKNRKDYISFIVIIAILVNSIVSASWMPIWKNAFIFCLSDMIFHKYEILYPHIQLKHRQIFADKQISKQF